MPTQKPKDQSAEIAGLKKIKLYALIQLVVFIVVMVVEVIAISFVLVTGTTTQSFAGGTVTRTSGAGLFTMVDIIWVAVYILLALWLLNGAFKSFALTDESFNKVRRIFKAGCIVLLVGFIVLGIALLIPFLMNNAVYTSSSNPFLSQNSGSSTPMLIAPNGFNPNVIFILGITMMVAGGIMYAIGVIWGLWKVGSRYNSSMIKAGAILTTVINIPIVGPILLYVGVNDALKSLNLA